MIQRRCALASLIEALHDGRLGPTEEASLQRHLPTCAACRDHQAQLASIRAALRAPTQGPTPLEHQRARIALLRTASGVAHPRRVLAPGWWLAVALVVAASAAAGVATWGPALWTPAPASTVAPSPPPRVAPEPAARAAPVAPRSASSLPRPAAAVPGPVVTLAAAAPTPDAATAAVSPRPSVHVALTTPPPQAAVVLARRSRRAMPARRVEVAAAPVVAAAPAVTAGAVALPPPSILAPAPPAPAPTDAFPREPTPTPASRDFAGAMQALGDGDFGLAARLFTAFAAAWPADPRSDEAAYLIAIAHQRAGRSDAARAAARRYLHDRPQGAHRAKAARLAASP